MAVRLTLRDKEGLEHAIRQFAERKQGCRGKTAKKSSQNAAPTGGGVGAPEAELEAINDDIHHIHVRPAGSVASPRSSVVPAINIVMISPGNWSESVQQYVAIGLRLRADGHRVRIAAAPELWDRIVGQGLEFYPLGGRTGTLAGFLRYLHKAAAKVHQHKSKFAQLARSKLQGRLTSVPSCNDLRALVFSLWPACVEADPLVPHIAFWADAIISDPLAFGQTIVAERLGVPLHCMSSTPLTPTAAFPNPLVASTKLQKPYCQAKLNSVSYKVLANVSSNLLHKVLDEFRHSLGLEGKRPGPNSLVKWKTPYTYLWNPQLLPKPLDWGHEITIAGYVEVPDANEQDERTRAGLHSIRAFAAADGRPMVYFGVSSTESNPRGLISAIEAAANTAQVRVIIQTFDPACAAVAAATLSARENNALLKIGPDVPAKQILPLVAAAVHCGDLNITSTCLAHAKPACVISQTTTQRLWGQALALEGVGVEPLEIGAMPTPSSLEQVFRMLLDPTLADAAKRLAPTFSSSITVKTAVSAFYANLPTAAMRCDLDPTHLARVYDPMVDLKLSHEAHSMMRELLECDYECLKYKPLQYSRHHVELIFSDASKKQPHPTPSKPRSMSDRPLPPPPDHVATGATSGDSLPMDNAPSSPMWAEEPTMRIMRRRGHALLTRTKSFAPHVVEVPDFWTTIEEQQESERLIHAAYERIVRNRPAYPAKSKRHRKK